MFVNLVVSLYTQIFGLWSAVRNLKEHVAFQQCNMFVKNVQ